MIVHLNIRIVHTSPGGYELGLPDREALDVTIAEPLPQRGDFYIHEGRRFLVESRERDGERWTLNVCERVQHVMVKVAKVAP